MMLITLLASYYLRSFQVSHAEPTCHPLGPALNVDDGWTLIDQLAHDVVTITRLRWGDSRASWKLPVLLKAVGCCTFSLEKSRNWTGLKNLRWRLTLVKYFKFETDIENGSGRGGQIAIGPGRGVDAHLVDVSVRPYGPEIITKPNTVN